MTDLEAQLVRGRDDVRRLPDAYRLAWALELGYGPTGTSGESSRRRDVESPVLSEGTAPPLAEAVHRSLRHLEAAHHWYGELGQTVWPPAPLCDAPPTKTCPTVCPRHDPEPCPLTCKVHTRDGCPDGCTKPRVPTCHRVLVCHQQRRPTLPEALQGTVLLAIALAVLQQTNRDTVSVQETAYTLLVAEHASKALLALPELLWRDKPSTARLCVDCGRVCQEGNRSRCYACRQRLTRAVRSRVS